MLEVCRNILQMLKLGPAVWPEVINLHRFTAAYLGFVGIAIHAAFGAVLRNLMMVMRPIVRVRVKFCLRRSGVGFAPSELAEELGLYRLGTHKSQIQVLVL